MKAVAFCAMVLSGLFLAASCHRLYTFGAMKVAFSEGRARCQAEGTDLAVVSSAEELNELDIVKGHATYAWIGLRPDYESWRWSHFNGMGQTEPEGVEFTNWMAGRPEEILHKSCTTLNANGTWSDQPCNLQFGSICYRASMNDSSRFSLGPNMDWPTAQSFCGRTFTDLAVVRDAAENAQAASLLAQGQSAWIGLHRDSWRWVDGSPLTYVKWWNGYPNNIYTDSCVLMFNGVWINQHCTTEQSYVCSKGAEPGRRVHVVKVVLKKTDPSVALEELDILQQLNQTLRDHGLSTDVKLGWRKQPDGKIFRKKREREEQSPAKKDDCDLII